MRSLHGNPADKLRSTMGRPIACLVLIITAQAAASSITDNTSRSQQQLRQRSRASRSTASANRTRARDWESAWVVRGGQQHSSSSSSSSSGGGGGGGGGSRNRGHSTHKHDQDYHVPPRGATAAAAVATTDEVDSGGGGGSSDSNYHHHSSSHHNQHHNIEKIAADLRSKKDHIATHIHARGEALAADLKAKQEKITDEVLRERSPEALGELGGHASSYDSATAGMDVASRRSFFLGIRRIVLLVQVVELLAACIWQAAFPFGGVAGFVTGAAAGGASTTAKSTLGDIVAGAGDGRGRLGLAMAASLAQFSMYTMLLVWFGCDRVVLRAVRVTGWEHGAAAVWALTRLVTGSGGKLLHLAVCAWLAGMTFLCGYFGRQL